MQTNVTVMPDATKSDPVSFWTFPDPRSSMTEVMLNIIDRIEDRAGHLREDLAQETDFLTVLEIRELCNFYSEAVKLQEGDAKRNRDFFTRMEKEVTGC